MNNRRTDTFADWKVSRLNLVRMPFSIPNNTPLIHVYDETVVLNLQAVKLLGITPGQDSVDFMEDRDRPDDRCIYIGRSQSGPYRVKEKGKCGRICSAKLARQIAARLEGKGSYRIEEDCMATRNGNCFYKIFFRKSI